jgi:hypothetical protein
LSENVLCREVTEIWQVWIQPLRRFCLIYN